MENCSSDLVRGELERILASEGFARNERISAFLRFVVEQELAGDGGQLKESIVGVEVFGRRPDYDVRQDSIVRAEAGKVRARLAEYYIAAGAADPVVIDLPKGGYRPLFRKTQTETTGSIVTPPETRPSNWLKSIWVFAAIGVIVTAAGLLLFRNHNAPIPIAVLPLVNLNQDPGSDYFADGLTGEIIRDLSIIDGLAVRSQTSSFAFKGKPQNVREAAKQLEAEYILEGSVLRSGQQLRVNTQLIRARDDFPLWSGKYDRELTDVFAIQDEISRGIVNSLRLKLGQGRRRYETSTEAYDLYLRARAIARGGLGSRAPEQATSFEQAISKDPSFAPAYSGLAAVYAGISGFDEPDQGQREDLVNKMREAAEKAIQLDPLLGEAHSALGIAEARDGKWDLAGKSFERALELDPSNAVLRTQFVMSFLLPLFRLGEAVKQAGLALRSDPLSSNARQVDTIALRAAQRFDEADALCPSPCIDAMLRHGRAAEAIPILEARFPELSAAGSAPLGVAYALAGRREDAERVATIQWRPIPEARIFTALGDKDRAFAALERAIPLGAVRLGRALSYGDFIPLRGDPRFKALRKRIGLPD